MLLQILQEDDDSPSASQKADVSPVSQAWFTTKEDKDTLANKGTRLVVMETQPLTQKNAEKEVVLKLRVSDLD